MFICGEIFEQILRFVKFGRRERQFEMALEEKEMVRHLGNYCLDTCDLFDFGYPIWDISQSGASFYHKRFNAYASPITNYPSIIAGPKEESFNNVRECSRCTSEFCVDKQGRYLKSENCTFHWGKISWDRYTCCDSPRYSEGCSTAANHVWDGLENGLNGPLDDFVCTGFKECRENCNEQDVFALDCEMCFTGKGLEVTKVTMTNWYGEKAYEKFIRPETKIVCYNTRFSGIVEADLSAENESNVATLQEVQRELLQLIGPNTILIGHALHNDLRRLKIVHGRVVDTSICFPHERPGFRHSLRTLTSMYLNRSIQGSDQGHDSFEDSRACLDLMKWRIRNDFPKNCTYSYSYSYNGTHFYFQV